MLLERMQQYMEKAALQREVRQYQNRDTRLPYVTGILGSKPLIPVPTARTNIKKEIREDI